MIVIFRLLWWLIAVSQAYNLGTSQTLNALTGAHQPDGVAVLALALAIGVALSFDVADWWAERYDDGI